MRTIVSPARRRGQRLTPALFFGSLLIAFGVAAPALIIAAGPAQSPSVAKGASLTGSTQLVVTADRGAAIDDIVSLGVPFAAGTLFDARAIALFDPAGREISIHTRELARWPADGSVRSSLVAFRATLATGESARYTLRFGASPSMPQAEALTANPDGPASAVLPAQWYAASEVGGRLLPIAANRRFAAYDRTLEATLWAINYAAYGVNCSRTANHRTYYDGPHALFQFFLRTGDVRHYRRAREEAVWYRANELRWHEGRSMAVQNCQGANWVPALALEWSVLRRMLAQGMLDDYLITGDPAAKEAVLAMGEAYRRNLPALSTGSRPALEATERNLAWTLLGLTSYYALDQSPKVREALVALVDRTIAWQRRGRSGAFEHDIVRPDPSECGNGPRGASPFMTALLVDGLMDYHVLTRDARVADVVTQVARWLASQAITSDGKAFRYLWNCEDNPYDDSGVAELNLMIVPVFGAAFHLTRDPKWLAVGDAMATAGLGSIYTKRPKQWNQAARGFGRYLGYRALGAEP